MIKNEIMNIGRRFLSVFGCLLLFVYILSVVMKKTEAITFAQIGFLIAAALLCALSSLLFISKCELTGSKWWIREVICLVICEIIVLSLTYYANIWNEVSEAVCYFIFTIVLGFGNHIVEYTIDYNTARKINRKLNNREGK